MEVKNNTKIVREAQPLKEQKRELVILRGTTTSQINQASKSPNPYPARVFFREENKDCLECQNLYREKKCPACQIPIIFRIKCPQGWERPKIKEGSYLEVKGQWANPINDSERKSFTATSFTLLACPFSQKKPYHCPIDCQCLKGQDLKNKVILDRAKARYPYWQRVVKEYSQQADFISKKQELEKIKHEQ